MSSELINLNKVGKKSIETLNELGLFSYMDILEYYPRKIERFSVTKDEELIDSNGYTLNGKIISTPILSFFGPKKNILKFKVMYNNSELNISIFNRGFIKKRLSINKEITIIGKYNKKFNTINASNILLDPVNKEKFSLSYKLKKNGNKISTELWNNIIDQIVDLDLDIQNIIPVDIRNKYKLIERKQALYIIHNPKDSSMLKQAIRYLKYEELFLYFLKIENINSIKKYRTPLTNSRLEVNKIIEKLPYDLTRKQSQVLEECLNDLTLDQKGSRLIQGDVGTGKTIIMQLIMYKAYCEGKKSIMISPTTILSTQHYHDTKEMFPNLRIYDVNSKTLNKELIEIINENKFDILIGTTSLLSKKINLKDKNIDIIIIDEQHRFGVEQRLKLEIDLNSFRGFYLSATPIPRTLEISKLGYISTSVIDEYPKQRKDIITNIINNEEETFEHIESELLKGHKIYIIVPRINNDQNSNNILNTFKKYNSKFKHYNCSYLHGMMKKDDQEIIFREFNENKIDILIATTIVEVGVNNKNATIILIKDAHNYGVSQLHQLRGRVGRSDLQSYCYFETQTENQMSLKRLRKVTEIQNGFELAKIDYKLRGSGNIISNKQSGVSDLKITSLNNEYDSKIANYAQKDAKIALNDKNNNNNSDWENAFDKINKDSITNLN